MKKVISLYSLALLLTACGSPTPSRLQEAWNQRNDPTLMGLDQLKNEYRYDTNFYRLNLQGALSQTPWSDFYWPTFRGGLTYRWNWRGTDGQSVSQKDRYAYDPKPFDQLSSDEISYLSPAEKYDVYMGYTDYRTTKAERVRTDILRHTEGRPEFDPNAGEIPTWEGLCHAWAPATLAFDEPDAVTLKGRTGIEIPFGSSDIKGLLSLFLDQVPSNEVRFLGGRCNTDLSKIVEDIEEAEFPYVGSPSYKLTEAQRKEKIARLKAELARLSSSPVCRDTNAGAFHIVLTNQIAKLNEGFVADVTRDDEVWNQPIFGFESSILKTSPGASPGAATGTAKELEILTRMDYIVEVAEHWSKADYAAEDAQSSVTYRYRLELNANDEIIGGEWLEYERPDFLWKQKTPDFLGSYEGIKEIYKASTLKSAR